jgi:D-3-phosphoglycerate dehydrogenase
VAGVTAESTGRLLTVTLDNLAAAVEGREVDGVLNGVRPVIVRKLPQSPTN